MRVRLKQIIEGHNMRSWHDLRAKPLGAGEAILALNGRENIARIIDHRGGVHTYYAEDGEKFDLEAIREMVLDGVGLELQVGRQTRQRVRHLRMVA